MATWFSTAAVLPQLREAWHLTSSSAAWLTIAVQLGFVAGAVASAWLGIADRFEPRMLIFAGAIGAALANLGLLVAGDATTALPLRFATGVFLAAVYPSSLKAMSTWFRFRRGTALGVMVGALAVGSAMPHLVNGLGGTGWRWVVIATSTMTIGGGLLAAIGFADGPFPFPTTSFDRRQLGRLIGDRSMRLATVGYFGHMWELYAMWAWFASFYLDSAADESAAAARNASLATFAVIAAGALGCWLGGVLGDRWGRIETTVLAMTISGSCAAVVGPLRHGPFWLLLGVSLIWGFWVVADSAQFSTIVTELADQSYVGTAVTLQLAAGFVLTVVTIWIVPLLRDGVGWGWAFLVLVPGPVIGVVAMLRLRRVPPASVA